MSIKELLGVPERVLDSFIKSAYRIGINPLPSLRKRFPQIDFRFTCNAYQKYASDLADEGKPYILVIKDEENKIIEARLEKYYFPWIHNPEYLEMPLPPKN
jgi:hypothetical protein